MFKEPLNKIRANGTEEEQPAFFVAELADGEALRSIDNGGGGYGDPHDRPPEMVFNDVANGYVTVEGALRDYGVEVDLDQLTAVRNRR